ncbi:hypothetical protein [Echinicola pacifica]|nr:hypothetical protein [Echinicola pacifica]
MTRKIPFSDISEVPQEYTASAVSARMVETLGFRFRYATEDLRSEDFPFAIEGDGRSIGETIQHIHGLSSLMYQTITGNEPATVEAGEIQQLRDQTLFMLDDTYQKMLSLSDEELSAIMVRGKFPFWNFINGPLADALWHSGQIATLRRANGNPMPTGVNVFTGTFSQAK